MRDERTYCKYLQPEMLVSVLLNRGELAEVVTLSAVGNAKSFKWGGISSFKWGGANSSQKQLKRHSRRKQKFHLQHPPYKTQHNHLIDNNTVYFPLLNSSQHVYHAADDAPNV